MRFQIYSEDTYCKALEVLAKKASQQWYFQHGGQAGIPKMDFFATPMQISEMSKHMNKLVQTAITDGFRCVAFMVDREGPASQHHRLQEIERLQETFRQLCQSPPKQIRVMLIIVEICLESWLLTDPDGLIDYATCRKGEKKPRMSKPRLHRTDMPGQESRDQAHAITQILQDVEQRLGSSRPRIKYDKADSHRVAQFIDPLHGSDWNESLRYFCEMAPCRRDRDGCRNPQYPLNKRKVS